MNKHKAILEQLAMVSIEKVKFYVALVVTKFQNASPCPSGSVLLWDFTYAQFKIDILAGI